MELYKKLRKNAKGYENYPISVCLESKAYGPADIKASHETFSKDELYNLVVFNDEKGDNVSYLPWDKDSGLFLELHRTDPTSCIFLTANLSGCFVGFRKDKEVIRVCHYNFQDIRAKKGDFAYYTHWIAPNKIILPNGKKLNESVVKSLFNEGQEVEYYNHYMDRKNHRTTVFGLFRSDQRWHFYLQDHTEDKKIYATEKILRW